MQTIHSFIQMLPNVPITMSPLSAGAAADTAAALLQWTISQRMDLPAACKRRWIKQDALSIRHSFNVAEHLSLLVLPIGIRTLRQGDAAPTRPGNPLILVLNAPTQRYGFLAVVDSLPCLALRMIFVNLGSRPGLQVAGHQDLLSVKMAGGKRSLFSAGP